MPDRVARGLWPHSPLRFAQLLAHLTTLLEENEWFPTEWHAHSEGEPVDERATIQRIGSNKYVFRSSRAHPTHPHAVAQTAEHIFTTAQDAARYFLTWDLQLPGDLDGWKVIE